MISPICLVPPISLPNQEVWRHWSYSKPSKARKRGTYLIWIVLRGKFRQTNQRQSVESNVGHGFLLGQSILSSWAQANHLDTGLFNRIITSIKLTSYDKFGSDISRFLRNDLAFMRMTKPTANTPCMIGTCLNHRACQRNLHPTIPVTCIGLKHSLAHNERCCSSAQARVNAPFVATRKASRDNKAAHDVVISVFNKNLSDNVNTTTPTTLEAVIIRNIGQINLFDQSSKLGDKSISYSSFVAETVQIAFKPPKIIEQNIIDTPPR